MNHFDYILDVLVGPAIDREFPIWADNGDAASDAHAAACALGNLRLAMHADIDDAAEVAP